MVVNPSTINDFHSENKKFLDEAISQDTKDKATIIVTHHVPTYMNYNPKYKGDIINECFAVEMFDFIEASKADYWIYGHSHYNAEDFEIGKTKMLTNQLGYVGYEKNNFKTKIIEV